MTNRATTRWLLCVLSVAVAVPPAPTLAQSYRTVSATRVAMGEEYLRVGVTFAAGVLRVMPGDGRTLYQGEIVFDDQKFRPVTDYDARTQSLRFGIERRDGVTKVGKIERPQRLDLSLAPNVPTDLTTSLGAAEAELELGGLSLKSLDINSGAAAAHVHFSSPNRIACSTLHLKTGAAEFRAERLGNARCERVVFVGGVGDVTLDFTGQWADRRAICEADIKLGLGQLTLRLPKTVGVAIEIDRFLATFERAGLTKVGSSYVSYGYDLASTKLHITLKAVLGDIDIEWVER
ncbi:MAG: hypothetical protein JSW71_15530 [Gemmatimonadota bacterium]|nr:MAG: hypothetical protein JSW71_15530 [Gemmatimonadota bacterium]